VLDINQDAFLDVITIEAGGYVRIYRGNYHTQETGDFSSVVPEPLDPTAAAPDPNEVARRRRALQQSIQPGGVLGDERFMAHGKLGIGRCATCYSPPPPPTFIISRNERDNVPVRYIIAHYYSPNGDAGSCSMRCHHVGRMGYDSFTLYASTGINALDAQMSLELIICARAGFDPEMHGSIHVSLDILPFGHQLWWESTLRLRQGS